MPATYNEIFAKITPLNLERIQLNAALTISRERLEKSVDPVLAVEILELEIKIMELDLQLRPLFAQLKTMQTKYLIGYEGEYTRPGSDKTYKETFWEEFWFQTYCNVDTTTTPPSHYVQLPDFHVLFNEVSTFIYHQRFSVYSILAIKKL